MGKVECRAARFLPNDPPRILADHHYCESAGPSTVLNRRTEGRGVELDCSPPPLGPGPDREPNWLLGGDLTMRVWPGSTGGSTVNRLPPLREDLGLLAASLRVLGVIRSWLWRLRLAVVR
jgi:hypothetical protein